MKNWKIITTRYQSFDPSMGVPVRTSIGVPKFWRGPALIEATPLYPYSTFRKHLDKTPAQKCEIYCKALDKNKSNIEKMLDELTKFAGGKPLVFMCYEDINVEVCHRTWIREWLKTRFDVDVREYVKPIPATREAEINPWQADSLF